MSSPFSTLQQIQIAAPCPVSSETGFFLQPTGGDEIPDGALDCCFGQTCVAGNGRNGRKAGTVLVASLAEVEIDGYRAGREVLLVEYPALPQRYSSASPFHRQLEQHGRVSVVTFGNNKFGQTPAIVLRGGCPYLFHCLRFQPQRKPDFIFYRFHSPLFPTPQQGRFRHRGTTSQKLPQCAENAPKTALPLGFAGRCRGRARPRGFLLLTHENESCRMELFLFYICVPCGFRIRRSSSFAAMLRVCSCRFTMRISRSGSDFSVSMTKTPSTP